MSQNIPTHWCDQVTRDCLMEPQISKMHRGSNRGASADSAGKNLVVDKDEEDTPLLLPQKSLADLPPEVVTIILKHLTKFETKRNTLLGYRLVSSQWKDILEPLLEKKVVSRKISVFPQINVGDHPDKLNICCSDSFFRAAKSPFPANSLLLNGISTLKKIHSNNNKVPLSSFMSKFGCTLTFLALQDIVVSPEMFVEMLGSMSSLKVLLIEDVLLHRRSVTPTTKLIPPTLSSLTTLELKSTFRHAERDGRRNHLYIWLAASYADQLERLKINTNYPFPALQQLHQYSFPMSNSKFNIASTSELAYRKLYKLKIFGPTTDFLSLSETLSLKSLSIASKPYQQQVVDLQTLFQFALKHRNTLETLSLRMSWQKLISNATLLNIQRGGQLLQFGRVLMPNVTKLTIHYPSLEVQERIFSEELLVMFPEVKVIQLLQFQSSDYPIYEMNDDMKNTDDNDLTTLQTRVIELTEEIEDIERKISEAKTRTGFHEVEFLRGEQDVGTAAQKKHDELKQDLITATTKKKIVFDQIHVLEKKRKKKIIVKQFLKRLRIWNTCTNLKEVSVRSGGKHEGDVCVIRRTSN